MTDKAIIADIDSGLESIDPVYKKYLEFVDYRVQNTDYHIQERLEAIEKLSDMISLAKDSYLKQQES